MIFVVASRERRGMGEKVQCVLVASPGNVSTRLAAKSEPFKNNTIYSVEKEHVSCP